MKLRSANLLFRVLALLGIAVLALNWGTPGARGDTNFSGRLDASFQPNPSFSIPLYIHQRAVMALQADGKVLFGGNFGQEGAALIRLTANGTLDPTFHGGTKFEFDALSAVVVQPDGKILLGGAGATRLLANGDPDPDFEASVSGPEFWWNQVPMRLALQADGKIVLAGGFSAVNGEPCFGIARLLPDGSRDLSFNVDPDDLPDRIEAVQLQANGRILIAGYTYSEHTDVWQGYFLRLMPNGTRDPSFAPTLDRGVSAFAVQPDGKIVAAGYVWADGYEHHGYIVRLNEDGSADPGFGGVAGEVGIPGFEREGVNSLIVQADGKILVGGSFVDVSDDNQQYGSLLRLNADGSPDADFLPRLSVNRADDIDSVTAMAVQPDGRILIAGDFTTLSGVQRPGIARVFGSAAGVQGLVSWTADTYTISEAGPNFTVTMQREGPLLGPVTVQWAIRTAGFRPDILGSGFDVGQPEEDFSSLTGTVSFADGEVSKTFAVPVVNDALPESSENFEIVIVGSADPVAFGDRVAALINVFDDDSVGLPGSIDAGFSSQISGTVAAVILQPDGKLLVGGAFTSINGIPRTNLLRLNADGALDPNFAPDVPPITALVLQSDGRIVAAGSAVTRLEANGTVDATFQSFDLGHAIRALAVQADGKILAGSADGLQRLLATGLPDFNYVAFQGMPAGAKVISVRALLIQPDGQVLVGGENTGAPVMARLNPNGTADSGFSAPAFHPGYSGFNFGILCFLLQPDGQILVGGGFSYTGAPYSRAGLVRLSVGGAVDPAYPGDVFYANQAVTAMARQPDGKLLIAENFGYSDIHGTYVVRLFENGAGDHSFFRGSGSLREINTMALTSSGALWIGGNFPTFNGFTQPALARLHGDDQTGPGTIELVESFTKVKENAGAVTLKLRRYWGTDGPVTVHYETADGTGLAGVHYTAASGTVSFANGEIEKSIAIPLLDDSTPDFSRSFTVTLSAPTGGASLGEFATDTVFIIDNDRGILARRTVQVASGLPFRDDYNVRENSGTIRIELFYVGDPTEGPISVSYSMQDGTAHAGQDYLAFGGTTSFGGPYSTQQDFEIPILSDSIDEAPETFTIVLSTDAPGVVLPQNQITVTIVDAVSSFRLYAHPAGPTLAGRFRLLFQAPLGEPFTLQASTDLIHWTGLKSFAAQTTLDPLEFEDVDALTMTKRFYRIVQP